MCDGPPTLGKRGHSLGISARVLGTSMRTTAVKWNIAGLYGPFAELNFFFVKKDDGSKRPLPRPEMSSVRHDCRQLFGFDAKASWSCFNPDV